MYKLNGLKIIPGERFVTKENSRIFKIQRIEGKIAVVLDIKTGTAYTYGVDALKRIAAIPEGEDGG